MSEKCSPVQVHRPCNYTDSSLHFYQIKYKTDSFLVLYTIIIYHINGISVFVAFVCLFVCLPWYCSLSHWIFFLVSDVSFVFV